MVAQINSACWKRLPALCLFVPLAALAQTASAPTPTIDWTQTIGNATNQLVTSTAGTLSGIGMLELAFFIFVGLMGIVIKWGIGTLNVYHFPHLNVGDIVLFMIKSLAAVTIMNYYAVPILGVGYSLHQLPSVLALGITNTINNAQIGQVIKEIGKVVTNIQKPSMVDVLGALVYIFVLFDMGVISLALFVINASSFVLTGILTLFGPIMIPFFMSKRMEMYFWRWLGALITVAMYRPICAGFTFVWGTVYTTFFQTAVSGQYSLGVWMGLIPTMLLLTPAFLYMMFKIPWLAEMMFGGAGAAASGFAGDVSRGIRAIAAAI